MGITIDIESANKMKSIFEKVAVGDSVPLKKIQNVLENTKGYQLLTNFYGGDNFKKNYLKMWDSLKNDKRFEGDHKFIRELMFPVYRKILKNVGELENKLTFVNQVDFKKCESLAKKFLPDDTEIEVKLYIVIDGINGGSIIDSHTICFDLWSIFPELGQELFIYFLAHELHHIGVRFWRDQDRNRQKLLTSNSKKGLAVKLVQSLLEEGSAKCFFDDQIEEGIMKKFIIKKTGEEAADSWVNRLRKSNKRIESKFSYIEKILIDLFGEEKSYEDMYKKVKDCGFITDDSLPLNKVVGSHMIKTIRKANGLKNLKSCIKNSRNFLYEYNNAAEKLERPKFCKSLVSKWNNLL